MPVGISWSARCNPGALGMAVALAAALLGGSAAAQSHESATAAKRSQKPAWQWTLEERLNARFDSESVKARAAADAAGREKAAAQFGESVSEPGNQQTINGRREPELFLPIELFRNLINSTFPEDGQGQDHFRRRLEEGAATLGFGNDLWQRLEKAAAPCLKVRDERYRRAMAALARSEEPESPASDDLAHCRALAQSLKRARAELGDEVFLRLLYQEVAPTLAITYNVDEDTRGRLRALEGGCQ